MFFSRPLADFFRRENSPRVTVKTKQVTADLDRQIHQSYNHYKDNISYFDHGASILATIIREACDPEQGFNVDDNDFKKYTSSLAPRINSLNINFDPVMGRNTSKRWFISNKTCRETIFGVTPKHLSDYPMDGDWSNYRPLRMVYHDSSELSLWVNSGYLAFKRSYPYVALYTFDLAAAALQWTYLSKKNPDLDIREYIHKYLILPAITEDNVTIWMLGNYCQWFTSYQRDYQDIPYFNSQYAHIPQRMRGAEREVGELIDSTRLGSVSPERLVGGLPLPGNRNLTDYYKELKTYAQLPDLTQYYWGELLEFKQILQICMLAMACNIKDPETATLVKRFYMQAQYLNMMRIDKNVYDKLLKKQINSYVDYVYLTFKKMRDLSSDGI